MKIVLLVISCLLLLASMSAASTSHAAPGDVALHVQYAGSAAEPYTIMMAEPGERYTIKQSYSWVRDETSRYNLVSYSIDGGDYVDIERKARGDFTLDILMDSPHSVTFLAVIQYPLSVIGTEGLTIDFSPPSPTHDNWFDINSDVTISIPPTTAEQGTRQQLVSWSFDKSQSIDQSEADSFETEIKMTGPHTIEFIAKTQYYVNVISEYGVTSPGGWYDSGTVATVSLTPPAAEFLVHHSFAGWEGDIISTSADGHYSASVMVDSPKTLVAKWAADYTQLMMVVGGLAAAAAVAPVIMLKKKAKNKLMLSAKVKEDSAVMTTYEAPQQIAPTILSGSTMPLQQQYNTAQRPKSEASTLVFEERQHDKKPAIEKMNNVEASSSYQNQIMGYALEKSIERLEALRASGMISDARFERIKEELEQTFH